MEVGIAVAKDEKSALELESLGYTILKSCVDVKTINQTRREIMAEYESAYPFPFRGGGQWFGHLNYVPSPLNQVIQQVIFHPRVENLLRHALEKDYKILGVGGNVNLPGSLCQPAHVDEWRGSEFLILNVPLEDVTEYNGSTEAWSRTHCENLTASYFNAASRPSVRLNAAPGDVIVRHSKLWHRGTPNKSADVRIMLAILVSRSDQMPPPFITSKEEEKTLNDLGIPFHTRIGAGKDLNRGFRPNYFPVSLKGNMLELTWIYAPRIYTFIRRFKKSSI
jgi:hypothetical protein